MSKKSSNALLGATDGFSLADSFGPQPALIVPSEPTPAPTSSSLQQQTATLFAPTTQSGVPPDSFSQTLGRPVSSLSPNASVTALKGSPSGTPPLSAVPSAVSLSGVPTLGPPPAGLFLLPGSSESGQLSGPPSGPPTFSIGPPSGSSRKSRYVPPPGIQSSSSSGNSMAGLPTSPSTSALPAMAPIPPPTETSLPHSNTVPDFGRGTHPRTEDMFNYSSEFNAEGNFNSSATTSSFNLGPSTAKKPDELVYHWFYKEKKPDPTPSFLTVGQTQPNVKEDANAQEVWKPFSMIDSVNIEDTFFQNSEHCEPISVDGGRYDVNLKDRTKNAVFWKEDETIPIRRCSWFYQSNIDARWVPYNEQLAEEFEKEYTEGFTTGVWSRKLELEDGEYIMFHSPTVMLHFPTTARSTLDGWGQVQPPVDPMMKPRVMHRGLDGLPEIPDGDVPGEFDHLVFVVHGIGSACDMKLRSIVSATDGVRESVNEMSEKHFSMAHLSGKATRIEFLPVDWHKTLHGEDQGTDARLKPLTLKSIPKLREFVNGTILDVLFYTSPVYCQKILDTVVNEINRMYTLFMARNDTFKGEVSIVGHSLGSLIMFDVLSNQSSDESSKIATSLAADFVEPRIDNPATMDLTNMTVEDLFKRLDIGEEHSAAFIAEGIDVDGLLTCTEDDLKEAGMPLGPRKKLLTFIEKRRRNTGEMSGLDAYKQASVTSDVKYQVGPAGTGQPSVQYPQLLFKVSAFYALGSPIGMFMAVRGVEILGPNFRFPTCRRFFNIFHPFDPVAYRIEGLINKEYGSKLKPVTIPHHKGRKRMHLELKDTVTKLMTSDLKQKLISSVSAALGTVYNIATGNNPEEEVQQQVVQQMESSAAKQAEEDLHNPKKIDSALNEGKRIDYALQEAPFETFNEYVFALSSHLCYWESEDTFLMMLKDIYGQMNVLSDDAMNVSSESNPKPFVPDNTPTAILAPPPTPMGGTMQGPSVLVTTRNVTVENMQNPTSAAPAFTSSPPRLGPPTSFVPTAALPPATPFAPSTVQGAPAASFTPSSIQGPPQTPLGPPPLMMAPPEVPSAPQSASKGLSKYPSAYPGSASSSGQMGMDPTMPIFSKSGPVAPPPISGFVRKQ